MWSAQSGSGGFASRSDDEPKVAGRPTAIVRGAGLIHPEAEALSSFFPGAARLVTARVAAMQASASKCASTLTRTSWECSPEVRAALD
jgi:hypothetical protein